MSTASKRYRLATQREQEKCVVHDYCEANGIEMVYITDYQIRLNGKLDIYPTAKKFCYLPKPVWGMYTRIDEVVKKYLNENVA